MQPDGTLAFKDDDHSYGGPAVEGDPLAVIKELAKKVAAKGVKEIDGRILIDASILPDGAPEPGTGVVMSSIIVNDNLIDLVAKPGANAGDPVVLEISPKTSYVQFVNQLKTTASRNRAHFHRTGDHYKPGRNSNGGSFRKHAAWVCTQLRHPSLFLRLQNLPKPS